MSRADLRVRLWDRPIKPLAVGIIIALISLVINGFVVLAGGRALIVPTGDDAAIGLFALVALIIMIMSWVKKSQQWYEWALLFTCGAFFARSALILTTDTYLLHAMLPFSIAAMAGGAFILERADDRDGMA